MKELFIIMATAMPEEQLIDSLEDAIKEYKINKSEDNRTKIEMYAAMFSIKGSKKDPFEMIKDMDNLAKAKKMFDPEKN